MINRQTHLAIGKLHASFALKGGVKVEAYAQTHDHILRLKGKPVMILRKGELIEVTINQIEPKGEFLIIYFDGYTNPEIVHEKLKGGELYVPRELASVLKKNEFYLSDLIGLAVYYNGEHLGNCVSFFEAAHTIIEVQRSDLSSIYLPFIQKYFDEPNFKQGKVNLICGDLLE